MSAALRRGTTLGHVGWVLRGNPVTAIAAMFAILLVLLAAAAPWLAPYDPVASEVSIALQAPGARHWGAPTSWGATF